jgi:hypothetical protein
MTTDQDVDYGAHLPLIELRAPRSLPALKAYTVAAAGLGYRHLCANDHLVFGRPWLDGPPAWATDGSGAEDLRLAARRRGAPAGAVPRARHLPRPRRDEVVEIRSSQP